MREKENLTENDLAVLEVMEDTILFGEFIKNTQEYLDEGEGKGWEFNNYQKKMLTDNSHYISICTGRATGKTESLQIRLIHDAVSNKFRNGSANEVLLVVQNKNQLEPVFLRFTQLFRRHPLLKHFIDRFSINFAQHEIKLLNGAMIRARIVGSSGDSNIIGMHTPCVYVDEAQIFNWAAWNSLLQAINTWDEGYQIWVSGVPNGLREKNVLFYCDQDDPKFSTHRLSRLESPRYTEDQLQSDLKQYGGENGDDYVHLVLGEHGSPAFSVFDRKLMKIENYPVTLCMMNNVQLEQRMGNFNEILKAPDLPIEIQRKHDLIACGIDAGFSNDPTIITILWRDRDTLVWREYARYELRRIKYPTQAKVIDWLDTIYGFNMICIDAGSSGLALCQILQDSEGDFRHKNYVKRLVPVDFQANVIVGYDEEGDEVKDRARKFTIQCLQKWSQNDQIIVFSEQDDDLISELERVGFTRDMLGQPKYFVYSPQGGQKGEDHVLASMLTWVFGYYNEYYSPEKPNSRGKFSDLAQGGWYIK